MKNTPVFKPIAGSKYPIPDGLTVQCGFVTVPEARSPLSGSPGDGRLLRIYVTIVKSLSPNPAPDPVVFLYGGPGGNSASVLQALGDTSLQKAFLERSDLVVFDQRGTGFSEPALFAPEMDALEMDALLTDQDTYTRRERYVQNLLDARQRFVDQGINIAAVNTPEIVSDLEDIRSVLGYQKINLFGISYGTRPALVAMRDFPASLRCVVLDSTVPVQVSQYIEGIPNAQHSFELLFAAVAADPLASQVYPDLENAFFRVLERLTQNPVTVPAIHPQTGETIILHFSPEVFLGYLCLGFYSAEMIRNMPLTIHKASQGDFQPITDKFISYLDDTPSDLPGSSIGMYYSVNLLDDKVDAQTAEAIERHALKYPVFKAMALTEFHLGAHIARVGEKWGARKPGSQEYQPVISDIPVLILAGQFDQNTPALWGRMAGETLTNSQFVEFPGMGHGVIRAGDCAADLLRQFYADPLKKVNTTCVEEIGPVQFVMPD